MNITAKLQFKKAMIQINLDNPFYACLLLNANIQFTEQVPTMGTDGKDILVNLDFVDTLTLNETKAVIVHEILHMIYLHSSRVGNRNRAKYNKACDYAINPIVVDSGFRLPAGALLDNKYRKMTAEEIYNKLPDEDTDEVPMEDVLPSKLSKEEMKKAEQDIKTTVARAINMPGAEVPDVIASTVKDILEPEVNWKDKLREFMQTTIGGENTTWTKPNRTYLHDDLYLPSSEGQSMPSCVIMIDTSGSIYSNKELFKAFKGEIRSIIEDLAPEQVDVFYVDTRIRKHDTYGEGEEVDFTLVGGGGTDFTSAWPKMDEIQASCIIAFTDLWATLPQYSDTPTLWACYGNNKPEAPFGTIIKVQ